ncbi:transmembrane protein, putative [Medicago truncatula]|uniref:Transmembrane protein, putative n=1 Tax=Medicago truncatula TaxID=3880 RepID=G7J9D9_MEDTR|nr:transmembrane protein, putative [Medicago truncatula]
MALTMKKMSLIVIMFGVISFILGIVGENKKPPMGVIVKEKDAMMCNYPSDPTVAFGYSSLGFLVASSCMGLISLFYSYNGTSVPPSALLKYTTLTIFLVLALAEPPNSQGRPWPTVTEQYLWKSNSYSIRTSVKPDCPTAKTGLMGSAAFLSLNSSLFWLLSLMLVKNAREDYLEDVQVSLSNSI